jgi:thiol-disulfide isomerase/thioredoxin
VVSGTGGKARFVVENYGDSELARRHGVTRYPAIFVDDILVATPKDFGFYGTGEGEGEGRYAPWRSAESHARFRADLARMVERVLAGDESAVRAEAATSASGTTETPTLPELELVDLEGRPITRETLAGRAVLVEFWATWCPPCRGTLSWLGMLRDRFGERVEVVAIAIESDEADVRKLAGELALPVRFAMGSPAVARSFGDLSAVPTLYLFDAGGRAREVFYGAPPDLHARAERALEAALAGPDGAQPPEATREGEARGATRPPSDPRGAVRSSPRAHEGGAENAVRPLEASPDRDLVPGRYRRVGFSPSVTFAVGPGWRAVQDHEGFFDVQRHAGTPDVIAVQLATPVGHASAADAMAALRARPGLVASDTAPVTIGGVRGLRVVVDAADPDIDAERFVEVLRVPPGPISIASGRRLQVTFLDTTDGVLAVLVGGSARRWDEAVAASEPVLASLEIGAAAASDPGRESVR